MVEPPTIDDIRAAAERVQGAVIRTPMLVSRTLSDIIGAEVWLKFENLQFTAAYKERGALNKLLQLSAEERSRGVIAASAGNHAQAVAYHAKRLGIPGHHRHAGADADDQSQPDRGPRRARWSCTARCSTTLTPARGRSRPRKGWSSSTRSTTRDIIAGAGTLALEMLEDAPDLDTIVVPIGGGGLMSGIAIAARAIKPDIELIGVEAELYPSMKCAIEGCRLPLGGDTLAEGIAVKEPGELTSRILKQLVDEVVLVPERSIEQAVAMLVGIEKTVVEGAGAAGLAALLADKARFAGKKVATILCGGNIDTHLARQRAGPRPRPRGRIARLRVAAQDQPGALAAITAKFHEAGVNIIEINHSRIFTRAAGQGHGDRGRVRSPRPGVDRARGRDARSAPDSTVERASLD